MANRRSKVVELNEASIAFGETGKMQWNEALSPKARLKGDDVYDIRDLVASVEYYESIDSPFLRADVAIVDSIDLYKSIRGKEVVKIKVTTESSDNDPLEVVFRVFKLGSFITVKLSDVLHWGTSFSEERTGILFIVTVKR